MLEILIGITIPAICAAIVAIYQYKTAKLTHGQGQ